MFLTAPASWLDPFFCNMRAVFFKLRTLLVVGISVDMDTMGGPSMVDRALAMVRAGCSVVVVFFNFRTLLG